MEIDLQTILPHLIGPQRTSFFPGRHIIKNIVVAQEVIPSMRNNKGTKGQMAIKMDLKKSYDRLSWSFIHETLLEAGIPTDFVQIILECITTIQMNLLRNGEFINEFRPSKGIRQGDPISAYIFVLFIERLGHGICHTVNMGRWKPIRLSQHCIFLTYLFFADDILLLAEALCEQATILCSVLDTYCSRSGARLNKAKTQKKFPLRMLSKMRLKRLEYSKYAPFPLSGY